MQVLDGQREILGKGAVPAYDPEDGAALAVGASARDARAACAAHGVDLPHDPLAGESPTAALDHAHELVPRDAGERVVAPGKLDVGVANPGLQHSDQGLARGRNGDLEGPQVKLAVFEPQGAHDPINMEER